RRHTRFSRDWSSDVCSSDLFDLGRNLGRFGERALLFSLLQSAWGEERLGGSGPARLFYTGINDDKPARARRRLYNAAKKYGVQRSEERRVGKEGRYGGARRR